MSQQNEPSSCVLLTGANGFIGVQIVKCLLERGHSVVGTVRSESKTTYLKNKFAEYAKSGKLKFAIVGDIGTPGAFDKVLQEHHFDSVLHTSSPFVLDVKDVEKELYEPAIEGTTGILKSIEAHAPSVNRVVITSSFASMSNGKKGAWPEHHYSEADWNPLTYEAGLTNPQIGYIASKKFAEKAAWDYVEEKSPHFSITTICPPMVYGPPEQELSSLKNLNTSASDMYGYFCGKQEPNNTSWAWVDVRDVALAHVLAIEIPAAAGQRYFIAAGNYSAQWFCDFLWEHYPDHCKTLNVPKGTPGKDFPAGGVYKVNNSKSVEQLGLKYRSFETMMTDTFKRFEELEKDLKG